jgi:hypothetical protein
VLTCLFYFVSLKSVDILRGQAYGTAAENQTISHFTASRLKLAWLMPRKLSMRTKAKRRK